MRQPFLMPGGNMRTLTRAALAMSVAASWTAVISAATSTSATVPQFIQQAVADISRPDTDRQRDVNRKPADVLTFAGVKPGDRIGELQPGGGYFTRIFCKAVGAGGHVYTVSIEPDMSARGPPPPDMPRAGGPGGARGGGAPGAPPAAAALPAGATACTNVTASSMKGNAFAMPAGLDVVWTSENYHDYNNAMYGVPNLAAFNKVVFNALKPGGVYVIEDHAAAAGSGRRDTETLHRIDPAAVIQDVTGAGFVLEARSDLLARAEDPHTANVFQLNGRSDKFLLKFRKPR